MQTPHLVFNWLAFIVSVVGAFALGALWYGPLFGKPWAKAMGLKMDKKPSGAFMAKAMGLHLLGNILTAYVLMHTVQVWRPSVWGVGEDQPGFMYGIYGGIFTWIGFYVPMQFGKVTWEGRPWKLFFINTFHDFILLQVICQTLANWR